VFHDPLCLEDRTQEGEERLWTVGSIQGLVVLIVVHTTYADDKGEEVIRIISARKATPQERRGVNKVREKRREAPRRDRLRELRALAAMPNKAIDTSDIPELTEEQMRRAVRGRMYRPVKRPVTMRLDADIIEWLRQQGPGYQTKANSILRAEMLRCHRALRRSG
jgi:uncharacterized protein (DUF4415 family)